MDTLLAACRCNGLLFCSVVALARATEWRGYVLRRRTHGSCWLAHGRMHELQVTQFTEAPAGVHDYARRALL